MIKQAEEHDILVIEEILLDAVMWMEKNKLQNQWNENDVLHYIMINVESEQTDYETLEDSRNNIIYLIGIKF